MSNFKTIIVPEALKAVQNADESFMSISGALTGLIENSPNTIPNILEVLQGFSCEEVGS